MAQTLYDKLWEAHCVQTASDGTALLYIDRHLIHEVTSPQAFEGLRLADREPWRLSANLAVPDHNVPTEIEREDIKDPLSRLQLKTLEKNCESTGIQLFHLNDPRQGIVHVIGPEQGATLPGMTIVCGDSHTSTHGAFAALAMGIGTSEVEHVLATQCLRQQKLKNMRVRFTGTLSRGVSAKDIVLAFIGRYGTAIGTGFAIEFAGPVVENLSMEGRMTLCNMSIEAGARAGMVAADQTTAEYLKGRPFAPTGKSWDKAATYWKTLHSDTDAHFDKEIEIEVTDLAPQVSWGTSPEMVVSVEDIVPDPQAESSPVKRAHMEGALRYMHLEAKTPIIELPLDRVFIGSCTNSRIEDLRVVAKVVEGKQVATTIKEALVVPGSGLVKAQAEKEGLDKIFIAAGFQWRAAGCSMCIAMNPDRLEAGEHCASTSNRNFEGRQGAGGCTHLVSPAMAAAAAVTGHFVDVRKWEL